MQRFSYKPDFAASLITSIAHEFMIHACPAFLETHAVRTAFNASF
jgi:hypothetical protein